MENTQKNGKEKDYQKLARIKSVVFLILAVMVLFGMYRAEKSESQMAVDTETAAWSEEESLILSEDVVEKAMHGSGGSLKEKEPADETTETVQQEVSASEETCTEAVLTVKESGTYTDKEHVALYLHTYKKLPDNYISKTKAKKAGWDPEQGNLREVCPGKSIGGGPFQNEEGHLPEKEGRKWKECDIDYTGGPRNEKRIVYSSDGLIYYTEDHYNSFEQLY